MRVPKRKKVRRADIVLIEYAIFLMRVSKLHVIFTSTLAHYAQMILVKP